MGRFEKLNQDIRKLAIKILEDKELCRLIYYPDSNPLREDKRDINGVAEILNKRLLLYTPDLSLASDVGTYVSIRMETFKPRNKDLFVASMLVFDVYSHRDARSIFYNDKDGNHQRGDRALLILDRIDRIMLDVDVGIGDDILSGGGELPVKGDYSGYGVVYRNFDFRNQGR